MAQGEGEQSSWLTLSEAAARSGLHKEALRARAKRGHLPCQRGNLGQLLVQLPAELLTPAQGKAQAAEGAAQPTAQAPAHPAQGDALALAQAHVEQLVELLHERELELAELAARVEAAEGIAQAQVTAMRELVDELKAQLKEARRPWWQKLLGR
jgi:hypothetical protein